MKQPRQPKFKVFARTDTAMKNGSYVKLYPDGHAALFMQGDYIMNLKALPEGVFYREYTHQQARALLRPGH